MCPNPRGGDQVARRLGTTAARHASIGAPAACDAPREGPEGPDCGRGRGAVGIDDAFGPVDGRTQAPAVQASQGFKPAVSGRLRLLLGALGAGVVALGTNRDTNDALQPTRFSVRLPTEVRLPTNASQRLALVPDGRRLFLTGVSGGVERFSLSPRPERVRSRTSSLGSRATSEVCSLRRTASWIGYNDARAGQFKKIRATEGAQPPQSAMSRLPVAGLRALHGAVADRLCSKP